MARMGSVTVLSKKKRAGIGSVYARRELESIIQNMIKTTERMIEFYADAGYIQDEKVGKARCKD